MIILVNQQIQIFKKLYLTFNDIAMPMSFYEETGVWGYMVNPDHKDFESIQKALKADPEEGFFAIYSKDVLFSYIYEIYRN